MKQPKRSYFLCSTPRSGSTALCYALQRTGHLGIPDEFISLRSEFRWGIDPELFIAELLSEKVAANGIFGIKAHYQEFMALYLSRYRKQLGRLYFVYLERLDKLGQAISLVKAEQQDWWNTLKADCPEKQATYNYDSILRALHFILGQEQGWSVFFAANDYKPLRVTYEKFLKDPANTVSSIAEFVQEPLEVDQFKASDLPPKRQRDATNAEWRDRFIEDTHKRMQENALASMLGTEEHMRWSYRDPTTHEQALSTGAPILNVEDAQRRSDHLRAQEILYLRGYLNDRPEPFVHAKAADAVVRYQKENGWLVDPHLPPWFSRALQVSHSNADRLSGLWLEHSNAAALRNGGEVELLGNGQELRLKGHYQRDDGLTVSWSALLHQIADFEYHGTLTHSRQLRRKGWHDSFLKIRLSADENELVGETETSGQSPHPFVLHRQLP